MKQEIPKSVPAPLGAGRPLALGALCLMALSACLPTDPADPGTGPGLESPPQDNGRLSGASSSTNWPAELAHRQRFADWSNDSIFEIRFFEFPPEFPPVEIPVKMNGTLHFYPGTAIPAFDSLPSRSLSFTDTESLQVVIPDVLASLAAASDTVSLNIHIDLDSLGGWIYGLRFDRSTGKIIDSPDSILPEKKVILNRKAFYFQGSVAEVTSLLPEAAGTDPEISYYIPGTPYYCKAQPDSFHLGPLPRQAYPLRVIRTSTSQVTPGGTWVEIWELRVAGIGESSTFTLGSQVLSYHSKGKITLRNKE